MFRHRIRKNARLDWVDTDMGDGYWIARERHGSCVWWQAMQLDAPGGYVVNGRSMRFSYKRDAVAQIATWKAEP